MKDIVLEGVPERVFPLRETEQCIVYIPLRKLLPVDYQRLLHFERTSRDEDLLKTMRDNELDNGQNALVQYSSLIEVLYKQPPRSLYKDRNVPDSPETIEREVEEAADYEDEIEEEDEEDVQPKSKRRRGVSVNNNNQGKKRKGPGRPPKNSQE